MTLVAPAHLRGRLTHPKVVSERLEWIVSVSSESACDIAGALAISLSALCKMTTSEDAIAALIIDDLREGYGVEDIAVRKQVPKRQVRAAVERLRKRGRLTEIYRQPHSS